MLPACALHNRPGNSTTAALTCGLRVTAEEEQAGLDLPVHGERGYDLS
ncbi:MAG: ammonium transporter [Acidimicrobiia bacterium]|nr:ammonium transporter [Acidimicrobiia bacterium]